MQSSQFNWPLRPVHHRGIGGARDALEGKGPQRRSQKRLDRRSEEVAEAVGGGYCRLQMPLKLVLAVRETVAVGRGWAPWRRGGGGLPPFQCIPGRCPTPHAAAPLVFYAGC